MVSFSIVIKEIPLNKFTNVLHFTTGGNFQHYGNRIPAVWVEKYWHDKLFIRVNTDGVKGIKRRRFRVELGKKYDITIKQWYDKNKHEYWNQLIIPGVPSRRFSINEDGLWPFHDVKLFTSDEWNDAFTSDLGELSNLKIENNEGDLISLDKDAPL